jgi:DNA-binding CsgD family transcriptional regulator
MLAFGEIRAILWSHFKRTRGCLLGVEPFESKKLHPPQPWSVNAIGRCPYIRARLTTVEVAIQLVSSHPVLIHALQKMDFRSEGFSFRILPSVLNEAPSSSHISTLWFFILDACSLHMDLGPFVPRCRTTCPRSKFLALLPPAVSNFSEKIRLFCWGMDGFVDLHETWQAELPQAVDSMLRGRLWVSREVLEAFTRYERTLLDTQLLPGHSLTTRERQVLQLLMRGLANKEISKSLEISERTAKFHVSNILGKLQLVDRRELSPHKLGTKAPLAKPGERTTFRQGEWVSSQASEFLVSACNALKKPIPSTGRFGPRATPRRVPELARNTGESDDS